MDQNTAATERRTIRRLDPLLVNQIAAGEVIERPASVVKELVENSIDAGAARILVELEGGGIELVRVVDDGGGIPPEELPVALAPHATSKVWQADDLDRIATKGFRGEALASIASVSRLRIRSRTRDAEGANEILSAGETTEPVRPASGPPGTTIEARNLFFNTPARRKFLRTPRTEQTRCLDWVRDLAMPHSEVAFKVIADGRTVLDLPPGQTPRERVLALLGKELGDQLVEVSYDAFDDARGIAIWGLAGLPTLARATNRAQHVFLRGRAIRDKTVQHAMREAYRGLIEPGRHPTAVLMLEMAPEGVDVNVHPAKLEVRFRDQSVVHQAVLHAVRDALRAHDLTPTATSKLPMPGGRGGAIEILPPERRAPATDPDRFAEFFTRDVPERANDGLGFDAVRRAVGDADDADRRSDLHSEPPRPGADDRSPAPIGVRKTDRVLQVHRSYLVTEDERGVVIIDQHALHERVMFEKLLARITGPDGEPKALETQRLLTPAIVPGAPSAVERLGELTPLLERLGVDATQAGPASVAVHSIPSLLVSRGVDPADFVGDLLERVERDTLTPGSEEALHEVLDMMACKAAVKAGDALSDEELAELMALRERVERSGSCPHGRSTTVRLSVEELEKLFDRR